MTAVDDGRSVDVLDDDECWRLLASQELGRLAVQAGHYPLVLPVNYAVDGHVLVLRTGEGTHRDALQHANVAFEVDQVDALSRAGWSVLVRGLAEEVTPEHREELVARTRALGVTPWAPGEHGHWVRILAHHVTGRRIVPRQLPPAFEDAAYR